MLPYRRYCVSHSLPQRSIYLSNVQSCNGKDPIRTWHMAQHEVSRLATICDKNPMEVALAISKRTFNKYINELVSSNMS